MAASFGEWEETKHETEVQRRREKQPAIHPLPYDGLQPGGSTRGVPPPPKLGDKASISPEQRSHPQVFTRTSTERPVLAGSQWPYSWFTRPSAGNSPGAVRPSDVTGWADRDTCTHGHYLAPNRTNFWSTARGNLSHAKWKQTDTKDYEMCDPIYMKCYKKPAGRLQVQGPREAEGVVNSRGTPGHFMGNGDVPHHGHNDIHHN